MSRKQGLIIFLMSLLVTAGFSSYSQSHDHTQHSEAQAGNFHFIKNKGQWEAPILYKCPIPSGNLFFESNRLVYNFIDYSPLTHQHGHEEHDHDFDPLKDKIKGHCMTVEFVAAQAIKYSGLNRLSHYHNYYIGQDQSSWQSKVPLYYGLQSNELYPGIELHSGNSNGLLKFEFFVEPGANAGQIQLKYTGQDKIKIKNNELHITTSLGKIIEEAPIAFQVEDGQQKNVPCHYVLEGDVLSFSFPEGYNKEVELVIDPTLIFSTYSGSFADNFGFTATYDSEGYLYSGSIAFAETRSYPTTTGAYQTTFGGGVQHPLIGFTSSKIDIAISKYDTNGSKFIYSTYFGGAGNEAPHSLVVNSRDELYIFGTTGSTNLPVSNDAYQKQLNNPSTSNGRLISGMIIYYDQGSDMFVSKLSSDGSQLLASSYIGGSAVDGINDTTDLNSYTLRYNYADEVRGEIDIDQNDNVYIASCTESNDFPMHGNSYDTTFNGGGQDGVIALMTGDLDSVLWSSYLGGSGRDAIYSLAIDQGNNVYVTGGTTSSDTAQFPSGSHPNHVTSNQGRSEGFITHFKSDGTSVLNSTFYGTPFYDQVYFVELDRNDNVFVFGQTTDSTNYFIQNALYNNPRQGQFISKLSPQLDTIYWSTTFGGSPPHTDGRSRPQLSPTAFLVDVCDAVYFSGWGGTTNAIRGNNISQNLFNMDTTADAYQALTDSSDFYLGVISNDASTLLYGSYFGGSSSSEHVDGGTSRFDKKGIIYQSVCAGCGGNSDFPILPRGSTVSDSNRAANCNNAVFKMDFKPPAVIAEFQIPKEICWKDSVQLKNFSKEMSTPDFYWDFGNGQTSTLKNPKVYYDSVGTYTITLAITDTGSCNTSDTIRKSVTVLAPNAPVTLPADTICMLDSTTLGTSLNPSHEFLWTPGDMLSDSTAMQPVAYPTVTTNYLLQVQTDACIDTFFQSVRVDSIILASIVYPDTICSPDSIMTLNGGFSTANASYFWHLSNGDTSTNKTPSFYLDQSGNYSLLLLLTDPLSCNAIDSNRVTIVAQKDTSYSLDTALNCNNSGIEIGIAPNPNFIYTWTPSTGLDDSSKSNPVSNTTTDINYTLLVDRGACVDTVLQRVEIDSIRLETKNDTDVCLINKRMTLYANSFGLGDAFHWSSNISFSDMLNSSFADSSVLVDPVDFSTTYYVRVSSSKGCLSVDSTIVRINNFGVQTDSTQSICLGDTVQLSVESLVPNDSLDVLWKPYSYIVGRNDTTHIQVYPPSDQSYIVEVENRINCLIKDTVLVRVSQLNPNDIRVTSSKDTVLKNQSSILSAFPKGFAYNWTPEYGLSSPTADETRASPDTTTEYTVVVYDADQEKCQRTERVRIVVEELYCDEPWLFIPNTFSPNGDGNNDIFYFRGKYIDQLDLKIYNRWGEIVFETQDQSIGWNGLYEGKQAQAGVFMFHVKATCLDGQVFEKKGDVTLVR